MTQSRIKISRGMLFACLMLGGVIFLLMPPSVTGNLQLIYANLFRVPLAAGRGLTLAARTLPTKEAPGPQDYERLLASHRRMENHVANLQAQLALAQQKIDELAGIRTNPDWNRMRFIEAAVMTDPAQGQDELLINRGQADGLIVGQYVLGDRSIIGEVSAVAAQTARIRLISNRASKIPVRIAGLNVRRIMEGCGDMLAVVTQVPAKQPAQVGEFVYALGIPGYPQVPIVTGAVAECKRAREPLLLEITVRPVCDIANLKSVYVIASGT
jgi:rod shape-determining protein MreC